MAEAENPPHPSDSNSQTLGGSSSLRRRNAAMDVLREASTRIKAAEAEMAKERETARSEASRRRAAVEAETARLVEDTQQRITSIVGKSAGRKRKRTAKADEENLLTLREGVLSLGLLQCNQFL